MILLILKFYHLEIKICTEYRKDLYNGEKFYAKEMNLCKSLPEG